MNNITKPGVPDFWHVGKSVDLDVKDSGGVVTLAGYVSTKDMDLGGDIVEPSAFEKYLKFYRKNPVYCFNHDPYMPIGKVVDLEIDSDGLYLKRIELVDDQFNKELLIPRLKSGVFNQQSIGFIPLEGKFDKERKAWVHTLVYLLENSLVSIAMNPMTDIQIISDGLSSFEVSKAALTMFRVASKDRTLLSEAKSLGIALPTGKPHVITAFSVPEEVKDMFSFDDTFNNSDSIVESQEEKADTEIKGYRRRKEEMINKLKEFYGDLDFSDIQYSEAAYAERDWWTGEDVAIFAARAMGFFSQEGGFVAPESDDVEMSAGRILDLSIGKNLPEKTYVADGERLENRGRSAKSHDEYLAKRYLVVKMGRPLFAVGEPVTNGTVPVWEDVALSMCHVAGARGVVMMDSRVKKAALLELLKCYKFLGKELPKIGGIPIDDIREEVLVNAKFSEYEFCNDERAILTAHCMKNEADSIISAIKHLIDQGGDLSGTLRQKLQELQTVVGEVLGTTDSESAETETDPTRGEFDCLFES